MPSTDDAYTQLINLWKKITLLKSCGAVLEWDEQANLPPGGAEHRGNQAALLSGLSHEWATSPRIGELLQELEQSAPADGESAQAVNVREIRRDYDRAVKLPQSLVEELSRTSTMSQQAWVEARKKKEFSIFLPWLEKIVALKRNEAEAIGYGDGIPYDALIDDYEPKATTAEIAAAFSPLRDELVELVAAINNSSVKPPAEILTRSYPVATQQTFGRDAAAMIGFNFAEGRLDVAAHPFCSGFGPGDCRLTTRYDEHHFPGAFFGTLHEAGHGIYEQGLDRQAYGTPLGETTSLGIHESQSRMWENFVGRSRAFWQHLFPAAQQAFPEALGSVALDDFYAAINDVRPSFIRVEADEVTYNLHIMLRFELEQLLIAGDLPPADLPTVWNETFTRYFGLTPPDDAMGCLQDIHWSAGLMGYFPTYALGNMYAAQFYATAENDLGNLSDMFARGEFAPLKTWLNQKIHQQGKQQPATRLVETVTGEPLSHHSLMKHLHSKFDELYQL